MAGFYIVDTETTGISKKDQVIQLALISISNNIADIINYDVDADISSLATQSEYFRPSVPIHPKAQEVHGLSRMKLLSKRDSIHAKLPANTKLLVAHNASFDKRMLASTNDMDNIRILCTLNLAKKIEKLTGNKFGFANYKLETMVRHFYPTYEVNPDRYHNAEDDCIMCLLVLIALCKQAPPMLTLDDMYMYFFEVS